MAKKSSLITHLLLFAALISGLLHISIVAFQHIGILPEFIFFLVAGVTQIMWAFLFMRKQDDPYYFYGLILHGSMAAMWMLTRIFPAPFVNTPEHIDVLGVSIFLLELLIIIALAIWHSQKEHIHLFTTKQFGALLSIPIIAGSLLFVGAHVSANTVFSEIEVNHSHEKDGNEGHNDVQSHSISETKDSKIDHMEQEMNEMYKENVKNDPHMNDGPSDDDSHHN